MMTDSKLLLNFDAQSCKASLQMPVYWSSASEIYLISQQCLTTTKLLNIRHLTKFYQLYIVKITH